MIRHRTFNVLIVAALALITALTVQGWTETTKVALAASGSVQPIIRFGFQVCTNPRVERSPIRRLYIEQMGACLAYTDGRPMGADCGLIQLLSNKQVCSK